MTTQLANTTPLKPATEFNVTTRKPNRQSNKMANKQGDGMSGDYNSLFVDSILTRTEEMEILMMLDEESKSPGNRFPYTSTQMNREISPRSSLLLSPIMSESYKNPDCHNASSLWEITTNNRFASLEDKNIDSHDRDHLIHGGKITGIRNHVNGKNANILNRAGALDDPDTLDNLTQPDDNDGASSDLDTGAGAGAGTLTDPNTNQNKDGVAKWDGAERAESGSGSGAGEGVGDGYDVGEGDGECNGPKTDEPAPGNRGGQVQPRGQTTGRVRLQVNKPV